MCEDLTNSLESSLLAQTQRVPQPISMSTQHNEYLLILLVEMEADLEGAQHRHQLEIRLLIYLHFASMQALVVIDRSALANLDLLP